MIRVSDGVEGVADSTIPPYPLTLGPGFDPVGGGLSGGPAEPSGGQPARWRPRHYAGRQCSRASLSVSLPRDFTDCGVTEIISSLSASAGILREGKKKPE